MIKIGDIIFMINNDNSIMPYIVITMDDIMAYIICIHGFNQGWYLKGSVEKKHIQYSHFESCYFQTKDNGVFQQISSALKETNKQNYNLFLNKPKIE